MRLRPVIFIALLASVLAGDACARSPLVILNNYTPPVPSLELISVSPNDHSQFSAAPPSVKVSFNEAIDDSGGSSLTVYDPYSNPIASGKVSQNTQMEAALPPKLLAGAYRIEWKATCTCQGHAVINGTSYFTIY